jgi:hypothetical protein
LSNIGTPILCRDGGGRLVLLAFAEHPRANERSGEKNKNRWHRESPSIRVFRSESARQIARIFGRDSVRNAEPSEPEHGRGPERDNPRNDKRSFHAAALG